MSKIKIICNPYQKKTIFQVWNAINESWDDITYENAPQSTLISDDIVNGFFQFKVTEIINAIVKDYQNPDDRIFLFFEGTDDDYDVLEKVCSKAEYADQIILKKNDKYLENAQDVLPSVKKIFSRVEPIIQYCVADNENIQHQMKKFSDASDDYIPVVVLGNYSAGKSTFINSIIGSELLPSGDEPITAKIYKIIQSKEEDRARVTFYYHDVEKVVVKFTTSRHTIEAASDNVIVNLLKEGLDEVKSKNIQIRLGKALSIINSFENDTEEQEISNLIEVVAPFNGGVLAESQIPYVIFDTPGSNSASNERHLDVLKMAMRDMTNGVPVFVSEYDSLDSTDNETLYTQIKSMGELDSRFAMIIVNKADSARLPSEGFDTTKVKYILNETIPKNLYSEGIYFVSSIMGLGAKNDGEFEDEYYSEIYDAQYEKYSNPNAKHPKCLYKYNIMPEQIKEEIAESTKECENLVYSNSGIYSVELGLDAFGRKYSPYNKCEQSRLFLNNVIKVTDAVIKDKVEKRIEAKENMIQMLDRDKADLLKSIDSKAESLCEEYDKEYNDFIDEYLDNTFDFMSMDTLKEQEQAFEQKHMEEMGYDTIDNSAKMAQESLKYDLKKNFSRNVTKRSFSRLAKSFMSGLEEIQKTQSDLKNTNKLIDRQVSDDILAANKENFIEFANEQKKRIDSESRDFWSGKTNDIKKQLTSIIVGSSALDERQREELTNIIIKYGEIDFESKADEIFVKDDFLFGLRFGNIVIGDSNKIRLGKLRRTFNHEMNKYVDGVCKQIQVNHASSYKFWITELLADIRENITDYSGLLHTQVEYIRAEEEIINDLQSKQKQIMDYSREIEEMISWR